MQSMPEPITLKVLVWPLLCFAPFFIAEEEGYFAEQGLEIERVKRMYTIDSAWLALDQGKLDVAAGYVTIGLFNALAGGARIKAVADKVQIASTGCASRAFIARRDLVEGGELDSPSQLQGRRIAVNPVAPEGYCLDLLLKTASLTLNDIEIASIPSSEQIEALENGTLDLIVTQEPRVTRIEQSGHGVVWMPLQEVCPDLQIAGIFLGSNLLDERPDKGRRFMLAYLKAVQQYNQGKTERNLEILARHTELDRELLEQVCWPSIRSDGRINVQSVLDFQAWAVEKGYLDSSITEGQFWDPSFAEYANEVLGTPSQ